MKAIAKAMGFPPKLSFADDLVVGEGPTPVAGSTLAQRIERLFNAIENPRTGERYSNADVARMSAGDLSEEEVEGMRQGSIKNPTVEKVAALAGVFGVEPSYLVDRKEPPSLEKDLIEAFRDETVGEITRRSARLSERDKRLVLAS